MVRQVCVTRSTEGRRMKGKRKDPEKEGAAGVWPPSLTAESSHVGLGAPGATTTASSVRDVCLIFCKCT